MWRLCSVSQPSSRIRSSQPCASPKYSWLPVTYARASLARTSPNGAALGSAPLDGDVGDVAGVADDIRIEDVDRIDDPNRPAGPVDRAVVGIGEQHDRDAVEARTQPRDSDIHPANAGTCIATT